MITKFFVLFRQYSLGALVGLLLAVTGVGFGSGWLLGHFAGFPQPNGSRAPARPERAREAAAKSVAPSKTQAAVAQRPAPTSPLRDLASWSARDPEAALNWIEQNLHGDERLRVLRKQVSQWARRDPSAAAAWIEGMPNDAGALQAVKILMDVWGLRDGTAAANWLSRQQREWRSDPIALESLAVAWAKTNPAAAAVWAIELFKRDEGTRAFQSVIGQWAGADPPRAVDALKSAPEELSYFGAASVAFHWAQHDPQAAAAWAQTLTDTQSRGAATAQAISAWSRADPQAAAAWLLACNDHTSRLDATGALVGRWVDTDAAGASEWIRSLPKGTMRDKAVAEFGLGLFSQNRELALQWTQEISDESVRNEQTEDLVGEWLLSDEEDARRWIERSSLPGPVKISLLSVDDPVADN